MIIRDRHFPITRLIDVIWSFTRIKIFILFFLNICFVSCVRVMLIQRWQAFDRSIMQSESNYAMTIGTRDRQESIPSGSRAHPPNASSNVWSFNYANQDPLFVKKIFIIHVYDLQHNTFVIYKIGFNLRLIDLWVIQTIS